MTIACSAHRHAEIAEPLRGRGGGLLAEPRHHPLAGVEQDNPRRARVDPPEVPPQGPARQDRQYTGDLDPGRATTDDDERQPLVSGRGIGRTFGLLERAEDASAKVHRVGQCLQRARHLLPFVVTEVGRLSPTGQDQAVVVEPLAAVEDDLTAIDVDIGHLGHQHAGVRLALEHLADRRRHVAGAQPARGDLVDQRLEEVMVPTVDDGDIHIGVSETVSGLEATEPATDDDHPVTISLGCVARSRHVRAPVSGCDTPIRPGR